MPFTFSQNYLPPAPVLPIQVSAPLSMRRSPVLSALVDTGADYTMIPLRPLIEIDAPPVRWAYVRGIWGERRQAMLYIVDLAIGSMTLPGIEVVGFQDEEGSETDVGAILGRNVINQIIVLLDGPNRRLDLLQRRPLRL